MCICLDDTAALGLVFIITHPVAATGRAAAPVQYLDRQQGDQRCLYLNTPKCRHVAYALTTLNAIFLKDKRDGKLRYAGD